MSFKAGVRCLLVSEAQCRAGAESIMFGGSREHSRYPSATYDRHDSVDHERADVALDEVLQGSANSVWNVGPGRHSRDESRNLIHAVMILVDCPVHSLHWTDNHHKSLDGLIEDSPLLRIKIETIDADGALGLCLLLLLFYREDPATSLVYFSSCDGVTGKRLIEQSFDDTFVEFALGPIFLIRVVPSLHVLDLLQPGVDPEKGWVICPGTWPAHPGARLTYVGPRDLLALIG